MVRVHMRLVLYQQGLVLAAVLISSIATGSIVYQAVRYVQAGTLTLGGAMAFFGALASLFMPVNGLTTIMSDMQAMLVVLRRVFALLDEGRQWSSSTETRLRPMLNSLFFLTESVKLKAYNVTQRIDSAGQITESVVLPLPTIAVWVNTSNFSI